MRSSPLLTAIGALTSALVVAGCSSGEEGGNHGEQPDAPAQEVLLQSVTSRGPDPFTESSARISALTPAVARNPAAASVQRVREVTGSTPGLYGGTRAEASCDVEQQAGFLAADPARTRAFAEAAGIPESGVSAWLRGLTPVVLRADARVTNHGYRGGRATAFQSVLQTGTAVLVDQYGSPRVRCACGNPLRAPVDVQSGVHQGDAWDGFDPEHVVVVRPTTSVVTSLVIVNAADRSWIERRTGSDGAEDRKPAVEPECDPDACRLAEAATPRAESPSPATPDAPTPDAPAPDRGKHEPARPETVAPAPVTPEAPAPEPVTPDTVAPETAAPEPVVPEPVEPYTEQPYREEPYPEQPYPEQPFPDGPVPDEPYREEPAYPDAPLPDQPFPDQPYPDQPRQEDPYAVPYPDQPETFEG
ncbi:DUF6777 domain-containing protein [Streptomyces sp. NPDC020807]|uniref:DUF6777 domain-containing protein n=1 Tax=Streptomyces sp. NPDC020807 TaxID=3155119 RepID=UPI0033E60C95